MNRLTSLLTLLTLSAALAQTAPMPSPAALAQERELTQRALGSDYGPYSTQARLLVGQLSETAGYEPCTLVQVFQTCAVTKN